MAMKNYYYRISNALAPTKAVCSGGVCAEDMESALLKVIDREQIAVQDEYYSDCSMLAGSVYRTHFIKGEKRVSVSISPLQPGQYR